VAAGVAGAAAASDAAHRDSPVSADGDSDTTARLAGFRQGLERLGWAEGRNIRIDYRFAAGRTDRLQSLAKELFALQPELILAHSAPIAAALQRESSAIPIVFVNVSDPIGSGFISSLARPGAISPASFEATIASAEAWFMIASVRLLLRRLARA
jgi:hypothetical protein